ncbi:hypothetical protein VJ918_08655 [Adlercreutzia sp. R21]|uniref:hypothetical protein n=1 Tax=Adlercreutzia wanghongyangiae TaxID=3111451 RepID=UPI002DB636E4|nr:hypothetical protein [Adlercreutzia sp. R21]MEC4184877.1 hypothetical protein [Adlercreutzia sp. R21]
MEVGTTSRTATLPPESRQETPGRAWWIVGGLLTVMGIAAYGMALGSSSAAGTSSYPWGPYIVLFYTAASAGAGLLMVGGIARAARLMDGKRAAQLFAAACALLVTASVLIIVDLGNPAAVFLMYLSANTASPLFFDALVLPLCIAVAVAGAVVFARAPYRENVASTVAAVAGAVAGCVLIGVEAWLLAACDGREAWGVLLGAAPAFLQAAALAAAITVATGSFARPWRALMGALFLMVAASTGFDALLGQGADTVLGLQLAAIAASPLFWAALACAVAGGVAAFASNAPVVLRVAAALGAVAVLLVKLVVVWETQSVPAVAGAAPVGAFPFSGLELLVALGALGLGALVYAVAALVLQKVSAPLAQTVSKAASVSQLDELELQEVL